MNSTRPKVDVLLQVDEICDEFERLWQQGAAPKIAEFVERIAPAHRTAAVQELVALEVALRRKRGEQLSSEELVESYSPLLPPGEDRQSLLRASIERALSSTAGPAASGADETKTFTGTSTPSRTTGNLPILEGYDIESVLGRGGMGVVYKAIQSFPRRAVALKMILADDADDEFLARFRSEAQTVADLNDPDFVQIYAFGESGGRPYMVLEYVEGGSLEQFRGGKPQPDRAAADMVERIARAMQKAHRAGVVHRDLKPHNVLLTAQGKPKIADFGLVKRLDRDSQLTADGHGAMGTPSYMAPEQTYGGQDVGAAADVYALGGILYCLTTGRPPFQSANPYDTVEQVRTKEPVAPRLLNPKLSRDLETICLKCLQKDPERRYPSAELLADDLRRYLDGRPIIARPVSRAEHAWRWVRRNPLTAALVSMIVALLVVAIIVPSIMWRQVANRNERLREAREALLERNKWLTEARAASIKQKTGSLTSLRNVLLNIDEQLRYDRTHAGLRKQLISQAAAGLDDLRKNIVENPLTGEEDPVLERTEAIASQRTGEVFLLTDRISDAAEEYQRAFEITYRLSKQFPGEPVHLRNLAAIHNLLASTELRQGNYLGARQHHQQSLVLREQWLGMEPDNADARRAVGICHELLGKDALWLGEPAAALDHFEKARDIYDALPAPAGSQREREFRRERAAIEQRLGDASYQLGHIEQAEAYYKHALELRMQLPRDGESDELLNRDMALSHMTLGDFYLYEGDPLRANAHYDAANPLFGSVAKLKSRETLALRDVATVQYRFGALARRMREQQIKLPDGQDAPEPQQFFETARKYRELVAKLDPDDLQAQIAWAVALARCGQVVEAKEVLDKRLGPADKQADPFVLFQIVCTYALCSEATDAQLASTCRELCRTTLARLMASGWKDRIALEKDPDLDPVRNEPWFQEHVAALQRANDQP